MSKPVRVLIVEDSEDDVKLALRALRRGGFDPTHRCVQTAAELEAALALESWDAVISDFKLPGFTGMDALGIFRSTGLDIPFMLVSGTMGEETAVDAMKAGASDYIMKKSLARLAPALERELKDAQTRAAHRRSESLKSAIIASSLDGLITIDHEGKIVEFNPAAEVAFRLTREQALGKSMVDLIVPPRLRDAHRRGFAHYLATGEGPILGKRLELEAIRADGTEFPIELAITAIGTTSMPMFTGIIRDISARKAAAEKIKRLNRVHAVLSGINTVIVRVHERRELFNEACRIVVQEGKFPFAWIGALDPVTQDVTAVAWSGEGAEELTRAKSSARDDVPAGKGAVGRAIRERRPVINNDIAAAIGGGPRREEILRLGFQSLITLPLFEDQAIVGTLTMYAREANFFDEEELRLLTQLAGDISFALVNISRQQKLDKLARIRAVSSEINAAIIRIHDRWALLRETCRIAFEHGQFELTWIALLDQKERKVQPVAWTGFSPEAAHAVDWSSISAARGTMGEAIQTRKPAVRNDIPAADLPAGQLRQEALRKGCRSTVCLPLVVDADVVALIVLFAPGAGFFDEAELALLNEVAGNISFALEHIEKEEKIARLSRIQAIMGGINALIVRVRDRQELFDETCRIAVEHGGFGIAWIGMLDPQTLDVTPVAHAGFQANETLAGFKSSASADSPAGRGAVGRAIRERMPVSVDLLNEAGGGKRREEAIRRGYHSRIALPLLVDDSVVGVMVLFATEPDFFNEEELKLLSDLAGDISFALENIAKQEKLGKLARIRAVSGEINAAIVRIHDREALLRETCRIAAEHGKFELIWIALIDREKQKVQAVAWKGFSPETAHAVGWSSINAARGPLAEAIQTRKPAVRNDVDTVPVGSLRQEALRMGSRSTLCLPLVVEGNIAGLIALYSPGAGFFDEEELGLLNGVAGNISFALEHIEKEEKIARLSRIQSVMSGINSVIVRVRDRQELFDEACRIAVEHGNFGTAWIGVLDP